MATPMMTLQKNGTILTRGFGMKRTDKLNGLKSWWNKWAKEQFKTRLSAEELKEECLSEFENTGSVEMRAYQCKLGRTMNFVGK